MDPIVDLVFTELDLLKPRSDFEFETFFLGKWPTPARQMIGVMEEILKVSAELAELQNNPVQPTEILKRRKILVASKNLDQLQNWWQQFSKKERSAILKNFENEEAEYWASVIGRQAAVEILSQKQTTMETMDKMVQLPTDIYEYATEICNNYINMVTAITSKVEQQMETSSIYGVPDSNE